MPNADPEKSFDVAVRHLFRHLDDASELRRNPLVRSAFKAPDGRWWRGHIALAAIRSRILDAGRACYAKDLEAGLRLQGERQFAIVSSLCSQRSVVETASNLALSSRQFYRYRRMICLRVGRLLQAEESRATPAMSVYDPLHLFLRRAASLVDQGFTNKAVAELQQSLRQVSSDAAKAATLIELSGASLELGDLEVAANLLRDAQLHVEKGALPPDELQVLRMRRRLMDFRIAMQRDRDRDLDAMMTSLIQDWESGSPTPALNVVGIEIQLENYRLCNFDRRRVDAGAAIARAAALERRTQMASPLHRVQIAYETAISSERDAGASPQERLLRFAGALDLSLAAGSARGVLNATLGLTHHCANLRDDDRARAYAERAICVARAMDGTDNLVGAIVYTASALLPTRHWRTVEQSLFEVEGFSRPGSTDWIGFKLCQGMLLRRLGRHSDAITALKGAEVAASHWSGKLWRSRFWRELALALHEAGRIEEARAHVRMAVDYAEMTDGAPALCLTYSAAAKILNDRRMLQLALQAASQISGDNVARKSRTLTAFGSR
jgi:tetratricopeptide (TPR) repeat protein